MSLCFERWRKHLKCAYCRWKQYPHFVSAFPYNFLLHDDFQACDGGHAAFIKWSSILSRCHVSVKHNMSTWWSQIISKISLHLFLSDLTLTCKILIDFLLRSDRGWFSKLTLNPRLQGSEDASRYKIAIITHSTIILWINFAMALEWLLLSFVEIMINTAYTER